MKKNLISFFAIVSMVMASSSSIASISITDSDKQRCYKENGDSSITFIYDCALWKTSSTTDKIYVQGSLNGWKQKDEYLMQYDSDDNLYYVTVPYDKVRCPGNSGQPEYKFVVNGSYKNAPSWLTAGYVFKNGDNNMIVVFSFDDFEQIKANSAIANTVKKITDFDLSKEEDQHKISNFRKVPGCNALFRCYHPFKASRGSKFFDTERERLRFIEYFSSVYYHVNSDICLSENETGNLKTYSKGTEKLVEHIPDYYKKIIDNNSVLYVGSTNTIPSYNEVYYNSNGDKFCTWIGEVVEFIIDDAHKAPFTIHCALGTDRTGVFSATIAALMGASWSDICADYQSSNNMYIQEFRDYHLLKYSFDNMLECNVDTVSDLRLLMENKLVERGCISHEDISAMRTKLLEVVDIEESSSTSNDIAIYSAPKSGIINIKCNSNIARVLIYDEAANLMMEEFSSNEIDISSLKSGVYFVNVVASTGEIGNCKIIR